MDRFDDCVEKCLISRGRGDLAMNDDDDDDDENDDVATQNCAKESGYSEQVCHT